MKENYKGYTIKITNDDTDLDPRVENDNMCTMFCFHKRYRLGDYKLKVDIDYTKYNSWDEVKEYFLMKEDIALIKPLYLYDHSGITISTSPFDCQWDSGQIGFIFVTKKDIRENFGKKKITKELLKKAEKIMDAEVKEYDNYLLGNVFRYDIYDEDENPVDSCCGYICDSEEDLWKDLKGEIESIIDSDIKNKEEEKQEKLDKEKFLMYSFDVIS